ncbi:MAG: Inner membrane protein YccF [Bacteroidetes bacterium ADurb.Bin145]|nr:MAG: Inner membrane protein YccF [Bacteroidetes bacterium ADurb.Bin145]
MKIIGNLLWLILGGIVIAVEYMIGTLALMITIIGIPFGLQTFKMSWLAIWPFGRESRVQSRSSGCLYILMNVIWLLFGGIWIALTHAIIGLILYITIIGIPFGLQHFKLTSLALSPFGRDIVRIK